MARYGRRCRIAAGLAGARDAPGGAAASREHNRSSSRRPAGRANRYPRLALPLRQLRPPRAGARLLRTGEASRPASPGSLPFSGASCPVGNTTTHSGGARSGAAVSAVVGHTYPERCSRPPASSRMIRCRGIAPSTRAAAPSPSTSTRAFEMTKPIPRRSLELGLSVADYESLLEAQGGVCAICYHPPKVRRLNADHLHATGEVRGLLCHSCNRRLWVGANVRWLCAAITYLQGAAPGAHAVRAFNARRKERAA